MGAVLVAVGLVGLAAGLPASSAPRSDVVDRDLNPVTGTVSSKALPGRVPVTITAEEAGLSAPVEPVGVGQDGGLRLPDDVSRVGWWIGGAAAGGTRGSMVIAGHVDDADGPGAMLQLRRLTPGMLVRVRTADGGSVSYAVTSLRRYHKQRLPVELFRTDGGHRLILITCAGSFDINTRGYRDNLVVEARPVRPDISDS